MGALELRKAVWLVLPVFPCLVMAFSCVFLVVVAIFEKVGLPEHLGDELIIYGQFYSPLSAVYWILKKDWLAAERETPLLPMAAPSRLGGGQGGTVISKRLARFS